MGQGGDERGGAGRGRAGWGGSKKSKPIFVPSRGVGLKSCPIPAPPLLQSGENLCRTKMRGAN